MFYVYRHVRLDKNEVFYIGKGHGNRAWDVHNRNKYWRNIVSKSEIRIDILFETDDEKECFEKEKEFIVMYGRKDIKTGTLCNLTNGGEGDKGRIFSLSHRKKISESKIKAGASKGNKNPMYNSKRFGELNPMYGKKHSAETRKAISEMFKDGRYKGANNPMYGTSRKNGENPNAKPVLNTETGVFHDSAKECIVIYNLPYTPVYFTRMLSGDRRNKTQFVWI